MKPFWTMWDSSQAQPQPSPAAVQTPAKAGFLEMVLLNSGGISPWTPQGYGFTCHFAQLSESYFSQQLGPTV